MVYFVNECQLKAMAILVFMEAADKFNSYLHVIAF